MIEGKNLYKIFEFGIFSKRRVVAVDGVDIEIKKGETLALIGESGSGKSTLGRMLLMLTEPTKGEVIFEGKNLTKMKKSELRKIRKEMQLIPQYPDTALDPRWTIYDSIAEPLRIHKIADNEYDKIKELIEVVGLKEDHLNRFPHELSGGELQRAVIARAMSLNPKFIVCDEPTSMLDVSVQASILNLLIELQKERNLSYLFITHDLDVANIMGHRMAVMYAGQIVEEGKDILDEPLHPYTQLLVKSLKMEEEIADTELEIKKSLGFVEGCKYYNLCPQRCEKCLKETPPLVEVDKKRKVRCHLYA
ncbi:ABC transporter ATP-binding protein [Methanocaldococcus sp. 16A]